MNRRGSLATGAALGVGAMAAIDTIVFHQLLGWHHFYDRSTSDVGLVSDGVLHAVYLVLLIGAMYRFADLRRLGEVAARSMRAGLLLGLGGFQLFDGLVNHKVLSLHQIRYGVDLLPYDLAWNLGGALLLLAGGVLAWRSRGEGGSSHRSVADTRGAHEQQRSG